MAQCHQSGAVYLTMSDTVSPVFIESEVIFLILYFITSFSLYIV